VSAWIAACSGKDLHPFDCNTGRAECSCLKDDTCYDGLVCNDRHLCVRPELANAGMSGRGGASGGATSRSGHGGAGPKTLPSMDTTGGTDAGGDGGGVDQPAGTNGEGGAPNGGKGGSFARGGSSAHGGAGAMSGAGATSGAGAVSAAGGTSGGGGTAGAGGTAGMGGTSGTGGTAGSVGVAGTGGSAGTDGASGAGAGGNGASAGTTGTSGNGGRSGASGSGGASGMTGGGHGGGGGSGGNCTEITLPATMALRDVAHVPDYADYQYRLAQIGNPQADFFLAIFYGPTAGYDGDQHGTFTLGTGTDANFQTCGRCALVEQDSGSGQAAYFFASKGTVNVASDSDQLNGFPDVTFSDVTLVEVTINQQTSLSTPVPGGRCLHLASGSVSFPSGWTCDPNDYASGAAHDCDCGCGVRDGDCTGATLSACDYCHCPGDNNCSNSSVRTTNNALCQ
jgi:hypothetical protein